MRVGTTLDAVNKVGNLAEEGVVIRVLAERRDLGMSTWRKLSTHDQLLTA